MIKLKVAIGVKLSENKLRYGIEVLFITSFLINPCLYIEEREKGEGE